MTDDDEYESINTGDLVELVIDPRTFGMAIGFQGSLVIVRFRAAVTAMYHEFELRKMAGSDGGGAKEPAPDESNVINFTDAKQKLTAKTKTRWVA